jgi:hypothetical protein
MDYFSAVPFQPYLLAPVLWALAWAAWWRAADFRPDPNPKLRAALLLPPALVVLLAALGPDSRLFFALTAANVAIYVGLCVLRKNQPISAELLLASLAALFAGTPESWGSAFLADFSRGRCIMVGVSAYVCLRAAFSARPALGICGALVAALGPAFLLAHPVAQFSVQLGLGYLLAHSLRWNDLEHPAAAGLRAVAALAWALHSVAWTHADRSAALGSVLPVAMIVLALYGVAWWVRGRRGPLVVPASAALSILAGPADFLVGRLKSAPPGLLAVLGSFVLLGLGTVFALAKQRWNDSAAASESKAGD